MRNNLFRVLLFIIQNLVIIWLIRVCFQYEPILAGILGIAFLILLIYYPYNKLWVNKKE